jgi:hypothetical protein
VVVVALLSSLSLATQAQVACWSDSVALWSHAVSVDPRDVTAYSLLAEAHQLSTSHLAPEAA